MKKKYEKVLYVRLEEKDYLSLKQKASDSGMKLSTYIRQVLLKEKEPVTKQERFDIDRLIYEINKIGTNLNQVAHHANRMGYYNVLEIKECRDLLVKILKEVENGDFKASSCK